MSSNLPPGVSESDIPGNRPEDIAWEHLHEKIDSDSSDHGLTDMDARMAWEMGLYAFVRARRLGATFPYNRDESLRREAKDRLLIYEPLLEAAREYKKDLEDTAQERGGDPTNYRGYEDLCLLIKEAERMIPVLPEHLRKKTR